VPPPCFHMLRYHGMLASHIQASDHSSPINARGSRGRPRGARAAPASMSAERVRAWASARRGYRGAGGKGSAARPRGGARLRVRARSVRRTRVARIAPPRTVAAMRDVFWAIPGKLAGRAGPDLRPW
jgi:hypothetical protein